MSTFKFKKQVEVYFDPVSEDGVDGPPIKLDVSEISFSQTFTDKTYSTRTLHNTNNLFESSNITSANPADVNFDLNVIEENDFLPVYEHLLDLTSAGQLKRFRLYVFFKDTNDVSFQIDNCVITSASFVIQRNRPLTLSVTAQGTQLYRINTVSTGHSKSGVEGDATARSATATHIMNNKVNCVIDGTTITNVQAIKIELQNQIDWTPYKTVNGALNATSHSNTQYPSGFRLKKRILSGALTRFTGTTSSTPEAQIWETGRAITITAGRTDVKGFQFILDKCTFTNRASLDQVLTDTFDFKLNSNTGSLSSKIKINNQT